MREKAVVAFLAVAAMLEEPARRIVNEVTELMALGAFAFLVEFAHAFWISGLFSLFIAI